MGGGTGGHVIPTLAVAEAAKRRWKNLELLYIGSRASGDRDLVAQAGVTFRTIATGKLRRYADWRNLTDAFKVGAGVVQALAILSKFRPDVVFAKGGYVALPVVVAARMLKIPVVAHESDAVMGLTNRLALPKLRRLAVTYPVLDFLKLNPQAERYANRLVYTGLPISPALLSERPKKIFANELPMVLVTGGSQGAHQLNLAVWPVLGDLLAHANVVHQTGRADFAVAMEHKHQLPRELAERYLAIDFGYDTFRSALKSADLVVSRSGSAVVELQTLGKAAVLVPLQNSANQHQLKNAKAMADAGAAVMIDPDKLTPEKLRETVVGLIGDNTRLQSMRALSRKMGEANLDAAEKIVEVIAEVVDEK